MVAVATVLATFVVGCSTSGIGRGESVPPMDTTTPLPSGSPSPTVTATPAADGPLEGGAASVTLTGEITTAVGLAQLIEPDVWSSPPGPMDLQWSDPGGASLRLSGTSFASLSATSNDHVLSLIVNGPGGQVEFTSSAGECSVTISPALPDNMGGVFNCASLTDATGDFTVVAQGTFSASG